MNVGKPVGKNKEYWKVMFAILKSMRCLMGSQWSCRIQEIVYGGSVHCVVWVA